MNTGVRRRDARKKTRPPRKRHRRRRPRTPSSDFQTGLPRESGEVRRICRPLPVHFHSALRRMSRGRRISSEAPGDADTTVGDPTFPRRGEARPAARPSGNSSGEAAAKPSSASRAAAAPAWNRARSRRARRLRVHRVAGTVDSRLQHGKVAHADVGEQLVVHDHNSSDIDIIFPEIASGGSVMPTYSRDSAHLVDAGPAHQQRRGQTTCGSCPYARCRSRPHQQVELLVRPAELPSARNATEVVPLEGG